MSGTPQHDPYGQNPYGQSPYGQNPYGTAPEASAPSAQSAPSPYGQQAAPSEWQQSPQGWPGAGAARPQRPGSITAAFWLILSAGALVLLSTVLGALTLSTPEGRAQMERIMDEQYAQAGLPADQVAEMKGLVSQSMPVLVGAVLVIGVLLFLTYLLIAMKIRNGSRAARTVGTVLAVLSVLLVLGNLAMGSFSWFDLLWAGLGVAGIVMAYRNDATEYMRLRAWEKAARR